MRDCAASNRRDAGHPLFALSRRWCQARKGSHVRVVFPLTLVVLLAASAVPAAAQFQLPAAPEPPAQGAPPSRAPAPRTSNPFVGSIPSGEPTREPLALTIGDAIDRALAQNLGVLLTDHGINRARGARLRALGDLLPNLNGRISESRQVLNLAAYGFTLPAGIPPVVGPFNLFDARVVLSQTVLDFKVMNDAKAEAHNLTAAQHDYKSARDLVVLAATISYAQALTASARVDAVRAEVATAEALFNQAADLKQAGL